MAKAGVIQLPEAPGAACWPLSRRKDPAPPTKVWKKNDGKGVKGRARTQSQGTSEHSRQPPSTESSSLEELRESLEAQQRPLEPFKDRRINSLPNLESLQYQGCTYEWRKRGGSVGRHGRITPKDFRPSLTPQLRVLRMEGVVSTHERHILEERKQKQSRARSACCQPVPARRPAPIIDLTEESEEEEVHEIADRREALTSLQKAGAKYQALLDQFARKYGDDKDLVEAKQARKKPKWSFPPGFVTWDEPGYRRPGLPPSAPQPPRRDLKLLFGEGTSSSQEDWRSTQGELGRTEAEDEDDVAIQVRCAEPVEEVSADLRFARPGSGSIFDGLPAPAPGAASTFGGRPSPEAGNPWGVGKAAELGLIRRLPAPLRPQAQPLPSPPPPQPPLQPPPLPLQLPRRPPRRSAGTAASPPAPCQSTTTGSAEA